MTQDVRPDWQKDVASERANGRYDPKRDACWGYDTEPMGGGNPYRACTGCGRTDPEINGRISGHGSGCTQMEQKADLHRIWDIRQQAMDLLEQVPDDLSEIFEEEIQRLCDFELYDRDRLPMDATIQELNTLFMLMKEAAETSPTTPRF